MSDEIINQLISALVSIVFLAAGDDPLDGDDTERIADMFSKMLDIDMGNT